MQFFCSKDKEYNDLATIFFNTQVGSLISIPLSWSVYMVFKLCKPKFLFDMLQDDAIRNLFSAKTFHEYSAQSLITFLV